jgi:hypothetical protein
MAYFPSQQTEFPDDATIFLMLFFGFKEAAWSAFGG